MSFFFENLYAAKPSLRTDLAAADYRHASHPIPWLESKLVLGHSVFSSLC